MKHASDLIGQPSTGMALSSAANDPRWRIIHLVVALREELQLTTSDIAALRGMVFLLPRQSWGVQMVVHASNRLLAERSDGLNERTLRRAIQRLATCGLLRRQDSANRKRYRVTQEPGTSPQCFGLDLSPLLRAEPELARRAEARAEELARMRSLRTLIRHSLYLLETEGLMEAASLAYHRAALRRKLGLEELQMLHAALLAMLPLTANLSASDSQSVRHIQKSSPEYKKERPALPAGEAADATMAEKPKKATSVQEESFDGEPMSGLNIEACLDAAPAALDFAAERPRNWPELIRLTDSLAPGLGIERRALDQAREVISPLGFSLIVLGFVQALERIAKPTAYLRQLVRQAEDGLLDLKRMFRSLTRKPPRLQPGCIPG